MSGWAWIRLHAIAVYTFTFLPVAVVVLLAFNANEFGSFPMTGVSFRWFVTLWENEAIVRAFRVSLALGSLTAVVSSGITMAAIGRPSSFARMSSSLSLQSTTRRYWS